MSLVQITNGNGKFGMSTETKLITGGTFFAIGLLLTAMEFKAFYFICYYKRNPEVVRPRNRVLSFYYDQAHRRSKDEASRRASHYTATGIPVTTVPPPEQFMQHRHYVTQNPVARSLQLATVREESERGAEAEAGAGASGSGSREHRGGQSSSAAADASVVTGTPLYINL